MENFILVGSLYFDKDMQKYSFKLMKASDKSFYFGNFGSYKYRVNDDVRILKEGLLFVKGKNGFDILDDSFGENKFRQFGSSVILGNLSFKILEDMCKTLI